MYHSAEYSDMLFLPDYKSNHLQGVMLVFYLSFITMAIFILYKTIYSR